MPLVELEQLGEIARARGVAAFLGRAELLQVQIADAGLVEARGKLALGEPRPARGRDCTRVDHQLDTSALKFRDHSGRSRLLAADGEEPLHLTRSINSMAAAGARTFPSWIT